MSIKACLQRAAEMGVISKKEAAELAQRYDEIAKETLDGAEARARLQKELEAEAEHRERAALLTEIARSRILDDLARFTDNAGRNDQLAAWKGMHMNFGRLGSFIQDAESARLSIVAEAQAELRDAMRELRRGWFLGDLTRTSKFGSAKKQARSDNFVRELFGTKTGDDTAAAMARAWERVSEALRARFNAAGGNVGKLERWGLPQSHDAAALLAAGRDGKTAKEVWIERLMTPDVLDRKRTVSATTRLPMTDADLRRALDVAFDRITTDGWSDKDVTAQPAGRGALYTQHGEHRFLHFADADAWMAYAKDFGNPDAFAAMMGHVEVMARDIAHMETFGPNANAMRQYVRNHLEEAAAGNPARANETRKALARADGMWALMRGVEPVDETFADVMQSARNFISATALGGAWISSLTDPGFGQDARLRIGMGFAKANFGRLMVESLRGMITMGSREDAVEAMLGLDAASNILRRRAAEVKAWDHKFWTGWMADRTLQWGLLSPWTQSGKHLAGLDLMGFVGAQRGKAFADLPAGLRQALDGHGIGAEGWERLRGVELHRGRRLRPNEVLASDRNLGQRYLQMILRETRHAVPEATVESRSIITSTAPPGTLVGEMARSMGQFKGFAFAVVGLKMADIARDIQRGHGWSAAGFTTSLLITGTILGALAIALKDVRDGRDPRKWLDEKTWLDPKHWGAAFLQAGGLGIYGDLLFSEVNRFGGGIESTVGGPLIGRAGDVLELAVVEPMRAAQGKKTTVGATTTKLIRRNVPFTNMWMWSVAYQRLVMDELQRIADPDAAAAFRREIATRRRDYGQGYWMPPGQGWPDRGPTFSRVFETR